MSARAVASHVFIMTNSAAVASFSLSSKKKREGEKLQRRESRLRGWRWGKRGRVEAGRIKALVGIVFL